MKLEFADEMWFFRASAVARAPAPDGRSVELEATPSFVTCYWDMIAVAAQIGGAGGRRRCCPRTGLALGR
jgi:hypothetical protein